MFSVPAITMDPKNETYTVTPTYTFSKGVTADAWNYAIKCV